MNATLGEITRLHLTDVADAVSQCLAAHLTGKRGMDARSGTRKCFVDGQVVDEAADEQKQNRRLLGRALASHMAGVRGGICSFAGGAVHCVSISVTDDANVWVKRPLDDVDKLLSSSTSQKGKNCHRSCINTVQHAFVRSAPDSSTPEAAYAGTFLKAARIHVPTQILPQAN